jgi:hypothetical protein
VTEFAIIKNAEPPKSGRARKLNYPFDKLDVGDAFDIPITRLDPGKRWSQLSEYQRIYRRAHQYALTNGLEFQVGMSLSNPSAVRVWRAK